MNKEDSRDGRGDVVSLLSAPESPSPALTGSPG